MKMCHKKDNVFKLDDNARRKITVNESWYIALFVVSRSIKSFSQFRRIRLQMFFKVGVLKNFANFTVKHLC